LTFPEISPPPVLNRLPDASERTLREHWDRVEEQLHTVIDYMKDIEDNPTGGLRSAPTFRSLGRTVRELDQYARALRWVMTITQQDPD
jgi:hypothetical protein